MLLTSSPYILLLKPSLLKRCEIFKKSLKKKGFFPEIVFPLQELPLNVLLLKEIEQKKTCEIALRAVCSSGTRSGSTIVTELGK